MDLAASGYLPSAFFDFAAAGEKGLDMVLKKICLSVYVFLLAGVAAFAQEGFELVGKVIDRETTNPFRTAPSSTNQAERSLSLTSMGNSV